MYNATYTAMNRQNFVTYFKIFKRTITWITKKKSLIQLIIKLIINKHEKSVFEVRYRDWIKCFLATTNRKFRTRFKGYRNGFIYTEEKKLP